MDYEQNAGKLSLNRRTFLRTSALAAAGTALEPGLEARSAPDRRNGESGQPGNSAATSALDSVNVLQGTDSTRVFSRGNTLPIAALPFGMAHWTIQSQSNSAWMFHPRDRRFQGFRCTHQLSPWLSDYGQAAFMPVSGEPGAGAESRSCSWRPEKAQLRPYSFRVSLTRYRADVELVPTERCAIVTARFSGDAQPGFLIETAGEGNTFQLDATSRIIRIRSTRMKVGFQRILRPIMSSVSQTPGNAWIWIRITSAGSQSRASGRARRWKRESPRRSSRSSRRSEISSGNWVPGQLKCSARMPPRSGLVT